MCCLLVLRIVNCIKRIMLRRRHINKSYSLTRAVETGFKKLGFRFLQKPIRGLNLKSPNIRLFRFLRKTFKKSRF